MMTPKNEIIKFSQDIEKIVIEKNTSYMDAIVLYCEQTNLEIEVAAKLISKPLREKIKMEAEDLNFLPKPKKQKKLPI